MRPKWKSITAFMLVSAILLNPFTMNAVAMDDTALYNAYRDSFNAILSEKDIPESGFRVIKSQIFDVGHAKLGVLKLIPAIHQEYGRLALFFARKDGSVAIKIDNFLSNSWLNGQLKQTNRDVICISSAADLDGDTLEDIIIISSCQNGFGGTDAEKTYNIGDVLFQNETGFYRDPHISDKINRFDMNKSAEYIKAFLTEGVSMEFLFKAKNTAGLSAGGFKAINYLRVTDHLEKFGVVEVIPGFYNMTGQSYLMIYIVDQNGNILWNFQPMRQYENFYDILAISLKDIDGDGNKDFTLLARYAAYDEKGDSFLKTDFSIYYQRAGYFLEDTAFKYSYTARENDEIDLIINKARQYWGWPQ